MDSPSAFPLLREFWRGLTTPDIRVVAAAFALIAGIVGASLLVSSEALARGATESWMLGARMDIVRASALAMQGAKQQARGPEPALLFVGPSALSTWLPLGQEASRIASEAAGRPIRVLTMSGGGLSYAGAAALIDRFGADFDGWIIIGVARQSIGREFDASGQKLRATQSAYLGFDSAILRDEAAFLGHPQSPPRGLDALDHWGFRNRMFLLRNLRGDGGLGHVEARTLDAGKHTGDFLPLATDTLEKHLVVLGRIVERVRASGRARIALVETPWWDSFDTASQTEAWRQDEKAYRLRMEAWAKAHGVVWLPGAETFGATAADFSDTRHIRSDALRERFLVMVVQELERQNP